MEEEQIDLDNYPSWLGNDLINDRLPWEKGLNISFSEFIKKYTLHDSCWIGLFYDVGDLSSVTLVINWDAVWLPDSIALSTSKVQEWPFLLIKIAKVKEVSTSNYFNSDYPNWSICDYQIESIDKQQLLVISSCMGGDVEITFFGETIFLALDCDRNLLNI
ncbi:MAG: hypothetical protein AAFO95_03125 [Cyanobacteria bacterium J06600_6]